MSFLSRNPMDPEQQNRPQGRQIQGGPTLNQGSPLTELGTKAGMAAAPALSKALLGTATTAAIPATATSAAIPAAAGTGLIGSIGASGAAGAAIAPALAAAGPFALMALPFLLNNGTNKVPEINYGPDPLARGYNEGTSFAKKYMEATPMGQVAQGAVPGGIIPQMLAGGGGSPMDMLKQLSPVMALGGALGLKDGTSCAGMNCNCASCKARKYNDGTMGVTPTTNMAYANGTDTVPSMLTPGEAVIPAPAAQNPANKPMINSMINEGRAANDMAEGMPAEVDMTIMAGPLSGKAKREQMKLLQDMSFKKKAFEAEEQRKQQAFDQKMSQSKMQYMLAMRQSQE